MKTATKTGGRKNKNLSAEALETIRQYEELDRWCEEQGPAWRAHWDAVAADERVKAG